jgi:hypothetical protein
MKNKCIDQAKAARETEDKYNSGFRYVITYRDKPVSYSKTEENANIRAAKLGGKQRKKFTVKELRREFLVPNNVCDHKLAKEIQRITAIVPPLTEEEELAIKEIALHNVMMQDLEAIVVNATTG